MAAPTPDTEFCRSTIPSPIGDLLLVTSNAGLLRLAFSNEDWDHEIERLTVALSPTGVAPSECGSASGRRRADGAAGLMDTARSELTGYFAGRLRSFETPLDLRLVKGFRRQVVEHLRRIPYGRTESYAEVARAVDNPKAVRAVGSACSHNPVPIFVPCHRVLTSDGRIGGYLGGLAAKEYLLELEGITVKRPR